MGQKCTILDLSIFIFYLYFMFLYFNDILRFIFLYYNLVIMGYFSHKLLGQDPSLIFEFLSSTIRSGKLPRIKIIARWTKISATIIIYSFFYNRNNTFLCNLIKNFLVFLQLHTLCQLNFACGDVTVFLDHRAKLACVC